ncbi:prepilin peptidase [Gammaproteobacteria bacterium AH-315-C21]|nr:prepilin peptidase [Gammaproteobacteria bacterium AH-315-C21]
MELAALLQSSPVAFISVVTLISLLIGSFLNVVIYRLPVMMERDWQAQCDVPSGGNPDHPQHESEEPSPFNLAVPRSTCPKCRHRISALENIPVISYLFLRGKCRSCKTPISVRYPIVELTTAVLSALVAWKFGFGWPALAALVFTWCLICLALIDFDTQYLPDSITLPVMWLGLFASLFTLFVDLPVAVIGAMAGYLSLWLVYHLFKLVTGKEGMGYGDFKLLAALGAWLGWEALPTVIFFSALVGAVVGVSLIVIRGRDRNIPIPFGPFLATAGWITFMLGDDASNFYLNLLGLS